MASTEPLKSPISASKGKSKNDRAIRKGEGQVSYKRKHWSNGSRELWGCDFVVDGRAVDKEDSVMKNKDGHGGLVANVVGKSLLFLKDMKSWQENSSEHVIENLKRNSVFVSHKWQKFPVFYHSSYMPYTNNFIFDFSQFRVSLK